MWNLMGTHGEADENKGKSKKVPPPLLSRKKKTGPLMSPC
jgi:hypothetical protein